jgi:DNA-binding MarR family transcriptional regulator
MTATLSPPTNEQARIAAPPADRPATRPAVVAWMRLARVFKEIDRRTADHLRFYDLSVAQFDVLAQVGAHEGITQQELANVLLVTKGNVTQLLDRMEVRGLVERRPARTGRGNHLYLTPAGWELNRRAVPAQEALVAACWAALDPAEIRAIERSLRTLSRSFESLPPFDPTALSASTQSLEEEPSRG